MNNNNLKERIKPNVKDYIIMVFTRYLPVTKRIRRKIRYKFITRKDDIVLYEAKSYIFLQIFAGLLFTELLYRFLATQFNFYWQDTLINNILALLVEYLCFLITTPLSSLVVYPFTGFWVRLEEDK